MYPFEIFSFAGIPFQIYRMLSLLLGWGVDYFYSIMNRRGVISQSLQKYIIIICILPVQLPCSMRHAKLGF